MSDFFIFKNLIFKANDGLYAWCLHLKNRADNNLFDSKTHVDKGEMCKSGSIKYWGADILKLSNNERSKLRSKTSPCIAKAMAEQWGNYLINEYNLTL